MAAVLSTAMSAVLARLTSRQRAILFSLKHSAPTWERLLTLAHDSALRVHVERTVALEEAADAQRAMEREHRRGKIVVRVS